MSRLSLLQVLPFVGLLACTPASKDDTQDSSSVPVVTGADLFRTYCSSCHAEDGTGTEQGPALQEEVERESVESLIRTILLGDDDMEPVDVTQAEAEAIVDYLKNELF
jgi:mono/diheme cytochrome c family protein